MKRFSAALLIVLSLFCFAPAIQAGPIGYAVDTDSDLWLVDFGTVTKTLIGNTGTTSLMEGLALSTGGNLYGTDDGGILYQVNRTTGVATPIGNTNRGNIEGLDYNGTTLLGSNFNVAAPTIFSINTTTAATTDIITATSNTGNVRVMAVLDAENVLVRGDGPPNNTLYKLNLTTGAVTLIGTLGVDGNQFAAMDFLSDGKLYGLDNDGSVWLINPDTAAVTLLGDLGDNFFLDMTIASVPEPTTMLLLGLGLVGLAGLRRK